MDESKKQKKPNGYKSKEWADELALCESLFTESSQTWNSKMWDWYKTESFFKGNHYLEVNPQTQQIANVPMGVTIPFIYYITKAVARDITQFPLKWQFLPDVSDENSVKAATEIGFFMDKVAELVNLEVLQAESVLLSLKFSHAPVFVGWDDNARNGEGFITLKVQNPFYFFPDPRAIKLSDAKYLHVIEECDIDTLKQMSSYDQKAVEELVAETKLGGTPIYDRVMTGNNAINTSNENTVAAGNNNKGNFSVFVKNTYRKVKENEVVKIKLSCWSQGKMLYTGFTDLEDYPYELLYCDKDPLGLYGEGWAKPLIPLNKMINKLETQKAKYMDRVSEPRYRMKKGSQIERTYQNGVAVTLYDPELDDAPEPEPIPIFPSVIQQSLQSYNDYIRLFGGFNDVSVGRTPPGVTAATALEIVVQAASKVTLENRNNLTDFIKRVAEKILWNFAHYQNIVSEYTLEDEDIVEDELGKEISIPRKLKVLGSKSKIAQMSENADPADILIIPEKMNVKVSVENQLAYTEEARKQSAKEMYSIIDPTTGMPVLDTETLLTTMGFGNVKDIERKRKDMKAEALTAEKEKMEMEASMQPPPAAQENPMAPRISMSMNYIDLPLEVQAKILESIGLDPTPNQEEGFDEMPPVDEMPPADEMPMEQAPVDEMPMGEQPIDML